MRGEEYKSFHQFLYKACGPDAICRMVGEAEAEAQKFKDLTNANRWGTTDGKYALSFIGADYFAGTTELMTVDGKHQLPANIHLCGATSGDILRGFAEHGMPACGFAHERYNNLAGAPGVITLYFTGTPSNLNQRLAAIIDHSVASMQAVERLNLYERKLIDCVKHLFIHNDEFAEHLEGEDNSLSENELRLLGRLIEQLSTAGTHFTGQETPEQLETLAKTIYMDPAMLQKAAENAK